MATQKHIYWHKSSVKGEKTLATIHLLDEHGGGRLAVCNRLAAELRETFPDAEDENITGAKVIKSAYIYGFTIVAWASYIPRGEYPGWRQHESQPEYAY